MAILRLDEQPLKQASERVKSRTVFARLLSAFSYLKRWRRWSLPAGLLCAAFILQAVAGLLPQTTERYYSRALYPHIAHALSFVNQSFRFSIAELLVLLLLAGCLIAVVWLLARAILWRRVRWRSFLFVGVRGVLWATGGGAIIFLLIWGFNYERQPLFDNLQLERRAASADELETICRRIVTEINQNYDEAHASLAPNLAVTATAPGAAVPAASHTQLPVSRAQLYELLEESYKRTTLPGLPPEDEINFAPPKPIYFSRVLTRLGISGMFSPFTGEANFNAEQPDCDLPFAIAHEMAHQRGFAREDEASFIAFLVCANSTHPYVRYSGYLNALYVLGALARVAPERLPIVSRTLGTGARADLLARYAFWTNYQGKLSATSHLINHAYLKANRIKSGRRNYNEVSALIVGYYLKKDL
ncbi:MAG: DUF3810 domain-containing protein [Pyrinomonadaceae bacterium]